ncbi:type II toxin-antitoxin system ParD family antitoxin [Peteryoungia ipomoeae]|uniref:Type II toxin-antitoxin system ParD family antitoxin n=1 Tax=Peteryoungia ipomoeae TaxID=1210932 RepID=A0A4S8NUQ2_9HYPH|nr:type II toxin-antitoxin system ParD family antitoxin [Peteryoungia ipomoeae]THV21297.1 type II toxin-antitoxin system ParD family antitoxin [Peteryoungia ipomoeae]
MPGITIALPDDLKDWIDEKTQSGEFSDSGAYVSDLIRRDRERSEKIAAMQSAVDAGLASGVGDRTAEDLFETARRRVQTARGA